MKGKKEKDTVHAKLIIRRVFAYKDDGWCSFLAEGKDGDILRLTGTLANEPKPDMMYEVEMDAEPEDTKYGPQYKLRYAESGLPETEAGIYEYLSAGNIKGIGKATAKKIIKNFGKDILDVIHNDPQRLLEVSGISQRKLEKIIANSEENRMLEGIYRLTGGAVTRLQAKMLYKAYGKDTVKKLRENPYKALCQIGGIGFLKADRIALGCGVEEFSPVRMENVAMYVLEEVATSNGDSYVTSGKMEREAILLLDRMPPFVDRIRGARAKILAAADSYQAERQGLAAGLKLTQGQATELDAWVEKRGQCLPAVADAVVSLVGRGEVVYDAERDLIASKNIYNTEKWIASMVLGMLRESNGYEPDMEDVRGYISAMEQGGNSYNVDQKAAFLRALKNRLSIVTGGPGCGKTTVIALIAGYWGWLGKRVYLMAPTGRASQRIKESMSEQLPGNLFSISTIHYLLANSGEGEELEAMDKEDVLVVCDESSMVDIKLAKKFLEMVKGFRVVLVGDADQLPPVGAGNFFRDLIASGKVPATWLTKNYRNTGLIIGNSKKIKAGETDLKFGPDFTMIDTDREAIPEKIVQEYMRTLEVEGATCRDICVLTLQRSRGAACVSVLNRMLQERYNPPDPEKPEYAMQGYVLRLGDRVIHIKNNYAMGRTSQSGQKSFGVFNGDLGIITAFNDGVDGGWEADFEDDSAPSWVLCVQFDDGSVAGYGETDLLNLELAYAMTTHKAQGSEFAYVIGTFAMDQFTMLGRAIAYTSVTRAKKRYCAVCEKKAFFMAVRNIGSSKRDTFLTEMMEQGEAVAKKAGDVSGISAVSKAAN